MKQNPLHTPGWIWVTGLLALVALSFPASLEAGELDYPRVIQADWRGDYHFVMTVHNPTDPGFRITAADNVGMRTILVQKVGDGTWRVEVMGRLIDLRRNGSFSFQADPEGVYESGAVTIEKPEGLLEMINGSLVISRTFLKQAIACEFTCSDGEEYDLTCFHTRSHRACCDQARTMCERDGLQLESASCAGTICRFRSGAISQEGDDDVSDGKESGGKE